MGIGCVKTCVNQRWAELFSQFVVPTKAAATIGFRIDEFETDIPHTN
jgi:hypothetical protein